MSGFFQIRRLHAWIACLAILFNALAPSLAHAVATFAGDGGGTGARMEICSMNGYQPTTATADPMHAPDGAPHAQAAQHCPFCATHAGHFALPPSPVSAPLPDPGPAARPPLFHRAPHPLFAWIAANPRAPPAAS